MDKKEIKCIYNNLNYILELLNKISDNTSELEKMDILQDIKNINTLEIIKDNTWEYTLIINYLKELINELQLYNYLEFKGIIKGIYKLIQIKIVVNEVI